MVQLRALFCNSQAQTCLSCGSIAFPHSGSFPLCRQNRQNKSRTSIVAVFQPQLGKSAPHIPADLGSCDNSCCSVKHMTPASSDSIHTRRDYGARRRKKFQLPDASAHASRQQPGEFLGFDLLRFKGRHAISQRRGRWCTYRLHTAFHFLYTPD